MTIAKVLALNSMPTCTLPGYAHLVTPDGVHWGTATYWTLTKGRT